MHGTTCIDELTSWLDQLALKKDDTFPAEVTIVSGRRISKLHYHAEPVVFTNLSPQGHRIVITLPLQMAMESGLVSDTTRSARHSIISLAQCSSHTVPHMMKATPAAILEQCTVFWLQPVRASVSIL